MANLTWRRLNALSAAVTAMLAGEDHEGDWPDDVNRRDLEAAEQWVFDQMQKRDDAKDSPNDK